MIVEAGGRTASLASQDRGRGEEPTVLLARCGWTLVYSTVLLTGLGFWGAWTDWPGAGYVAPLLVLIGIAGTTSVWLVRDPATRIWSWVGLAASVVVVGLPQAVAIHMRQYYSTDSAALNHVAARVLAQGRNPYTASMSSASKLLKTPSQYWTYTVDGGHILHVSYPAGSFLLDAPGFVLGFRHAVVDWVDLAAWLLTGVLLFLIVPVALRWFALLVMVTSVFVQMFSNGGTDALFLPFLLVAIWRWDRFATGKGAGLAGWLGPVALGLACSIKQTPWFCVPFLMVGVALEAPRSSRNPWAIASLYLAIVAVIFFAVNLPFIIWDGGAWWNGTLLPFTHPLVADGQGLVALALHGVTGGVSLPLLSVSAALAYVALMAAYIAWFPSMKRVWLFLLPAVLFIPARSLSSYLVDFIPMAVAGAVTVGVLAGPGAIPGPAKASPLGVRRRWWPLPSVLAPAALAGVVAAVAFNSVPLAVSVSGFHTSNATLELDSVTVSVHNRTDHQVTPHFMVALGGAHPTGFWRATSGSGTTVLAAGATETVVLRPKLYTWSPTHGSYWLVEAYTLSPNALSTTPPLKWKLGKPLDGG